VISAEDVPAEFAGRAVRVKRLEIVKVEAVVRGYLTGSGLAEYEKSGTVCGLELPGGLVDGSRLPEPIYTPTTKADVGDHDLPMTYEDTEAKLGPDLAARIRELTFALYRRGAEIALDKGIIIADTKFEFGIDAEGTLRLADEALTSDSSRFWDAAAWKPGQTQPSFDKQFVRDWARSTGWRPDDAEAPEIPQDVAEATLARYIEAYELLTGRTWS
jgi:phosphoribosylaminoimidazole-succinocarboxamide synthase